MRNFSLPTLSSLTTFLFFLFVFLWQFSLAQQKAFPTAVGAGAYTIGGRGGIAVHVTNLNASGPGSFAEALKMTVPRTIVFDVSGIINIDKLLYVGPESSNFTIAGQTAPEGGITIAGGRVYFSGVTNYIMRYIRFKGGFQADWVPNSGDNLGSASFVAVGNINECIVDHVSFGFGKTMPVWVKQGSGIGIVDKTTIQRCLFSETDKGAIIGQDVDNTPYYLTGDMTFSKNIFYNTKYRTPNTTGNHGPNNSFDIINNLTWQSQGRMIRSSGDQNINHLNNANYVGNIMLTDQNLNLWSNGWTPKIYTNGNLIVVNNSTNLTNSVSEMNADNKLSWKYFVGDNYGVQLPSSFFKSTPYPIRGEEQSILDANDLRLTLPNDSGCNARLNADGSVSTNLDTHDSEYLENILNNIMVSPLTTYILDPIPSQTRPSNFYQSNPHIPEIWFQANVPAGQDHNDIAPSGYTWLEEYLNQVDRDSNTQEPIEVSGVSVSPNEATININGTTTLTATVAPANATNSTGTWSSENESIATVDQSGLVTGIATGETTITFTTNDGDFTDSAVITVTSEVEPGPELPLRYGFFVRETMQELAVLSPGVTSTISLEDIEGLELSFGAVDLDNFSGSCRITFDGEIKIENVDPYTTTQRAFTEGLHTVQYEIFSELNAQGDLLETIELSILIAQPDPVNVTAVTLTPNTVELQIAETIALTSNISPTNATNQSGVWSSSDESIATVDASGVVTAVSQGVVIITFTTNDGGFTDTSEITVFPEAFQASAGNDQQICEGESTTLTASGGTNYIWNTGETNASITVSPTATTTYSVTVSDNNGNSGSAEVTITVNPLPQATAGQDQSICIGESITLTASGGSSYLWSNGATTQTINVSPTQTTIYTVEVTENGCSSTDDVTVTVNPIPTVNAGNDVTIALGQTANLTASGASSYSWSNGQTGATISVSPSETTTYTVTGTTNACSSSDQVTVFIAGEIAANINGNQNICAGESTTLTATGGDYFLWNTGQTTASITVNPTQTTSYSVEVSDDFGNLDTANVTITVNSIPQANAGQDQSICAGESVTLTASGGSSYLWSNGATSQTITVSPTQTVTYTVQVTENSCSSTDEVTVTVTNQPDLQINGNTTIVYGQSTTLTVSGANSYSWSTGQSSSSITVQPQTTTTYEVTGFINDCSKTINVTVVVESHVQASAGENKRICQGDDITLTATGGSSYLWNTGATTQSIIVSPTSTATYSVTVFDGPFQDTASVNVAVDPNPNVTIINGDEATILQGNFITISARGANSYRWNNGATQPNIAVSPSTTTTYQVKGFINECYDEKEIRINVVPRVIADAGEDVVICAQESAVLTATGGDDFLWSTGETTQTIEVTPEETTIYTVTVFNELDFDEASVMVMVDQQCQTVVFPDDEEDPTYTFLVHPNPVKDILNIQLNNAINITTLQMFDVAGKLLFSEQLGLANEPYSYQKQVDVSSFQSGLYFVRLVDLDRVITKKILVQ